MIKLPIYALVIIVLFAAALGYSIACLMVTAAKADEQPKPTKGRKRVYICSPLRGDMERNIIKAQGYCREALDMGVLPIAPHVYFTQFTSDLIPKERALGLKLGKELLLTCSEVWVYGIQNPSEGMKGEIELAKSYGIPVRDAVDVYAARTPGGECLD